MRSLTIVGVVAMAIVSSLVVHAKDMTLAEASGKIGEVIVTPSKAASVIGSLSAADQVAYLAKLNEAIEKFPGSPEEKVAKYYEINKAALIAAKRGNMTALLAETYATVSPEALTIINEKYASDLFNRAANPARVFTDEEYSKIAKEKLAVISERLKTAENSSVRTAFAALMFIRASNGTPASLRDELIAQLPTAEARKMASDEWFPAALADGQNKSYESMLGASDAGETPNFHAVIQYVSVEDMRVALLSDLSNTTTSMSGTSGQILSENVMNRTEYAMPHDMRVGINAIPRTQDPDKPWNPNYIREPGGYPNQTTGMRY